MKRILSLILTLVLMASLFAACGGSNNSSSSAPADSGSTTESSGESVESDPSEAPVEASGYTVAMITDVGGINDESFNQSAWDGMKRLEAELGVTISFMESSKDADYAPNLEKKTDENPDVIWGIGFLMKDAVAEAAANNPDQLYALIDDSFDGMDLPNTIGVIFQAEQSSFLAGYAAGYKTETNHVGFIVGMESPTMDRFKYGYLAGVAYAAKEQDKEIKADTDVVEAFDDSAKGKAMAQKMYTDGADVIFHAAGQSGSGCIEAAKEMNKMAIGVDLDQNWLAPDNVITSGLKNVGNAVYTISERIKNGEDLGGQTIYMGLAEGGVGLAPSSNIHLSAELLADIETLEDSIIAGNIVVPYTLDEYNAFIAAL